MKNRLNLDWTISSAKERTIFLQKYLQQDIFLKKPPNEEELETMGNYLLWGQDEDGLNLDQKKEIQLPRKNSTWSSQNLESIEELMENPTFSENSFHKLGSISPKKSRTVFSREETRRFLTPSELQPFEELWKEIDKTELVINFFELEKGKRTKPPREELLTAFSEEEISSLKLQSQRLNQFKYLKLRHLLVELRRQQYTLKDSARPTIVSFGESRGPVPAEEDPIFEVDIPVLPLGLSKSLIFRDFEELVPPSFNEEEIWEITKLYWRKKDEEKHLQQNNRIFFFDFRDLEMVYQLFLGLEDINEEEEKVFSTNSRFLDTLWYYVRQANLTDVQKEILELKIKRQKNQEIAAYINKKYQKSYTTNYISTIFRQKIIPTINEAASYHEKIVGSLPFEEEFKRCTKCGRLLWRDAANFVRRSRAKDGLSNHCKKCDKEDRERKKEVVIKENG